MFSHFFLGFLFSFYVSKVTGKSKVIGSVSFLYLFIPHVPDRSIQSIVFFCVSSLLFALFVLSLSYMPRLIWPRLALPPEDQELRSQRR